MVLKKSLLVTLVLIFFGCLLANVGAELQFACLAKSADPDSGRIFGVTINHGTHVYLTQRELDRLHFEQGPLLAVAMIDFAAIGLWKVFGKNIWN